jgi:uncharacterized membrane protein (UPF0182 family)
MREKIEYIVSFVILVVIVIFYWYSRNIVSGYYELLWFQNVEYSGMMTKFLLIIPLMIYLVAIIMEIVKWIKRRVVQ